MNSLIYFVLAASVLALAMAFVFYKQMLSKEEGTDLMKKIAAHVRKGAMAYLKQQYKVVIIVFVVLAAIFGVMAFFGLQNEWVWFAFLTGGLFSGLAGYFGMKTATYASARTANAARKSLNSGLQVAFRSGAVMGLVVVGLALLDISLWYIVLKHNKQNGNYPTGFDREFARKGDVGQQLFVLGLVDQRAEQHQKTRHQCKDGKKAQQNRLNHHNCHIQTDAEFHKGQRCQTADGGQTRSSDLRDCLAQRNNGGFPGTLGFMLVGEPVA